MPNFRRRRGDHVTYTPDQTRRYQSQLVRWFKGRSIRPQGVQQSGNNILYRFRSDRASTGFWTTTFTPGGVSDPRRFPPVYALGVSNCDAAPCLTNLQWVKIHYTVLDESWANRLEGGWYSEGQNYIDQTTYAHFPGATSYPPEAWATPTYLGPCSAVGGCSYYVNTETFTTEYAEPDYPGETQDTVYTICVGGALYSLSAISNGGSYDAPPSPIYPDAGSGTSGSPGMRRFVSTIEFEFYSGNPATLAARCGTSVPGYPIGSGDTFWHCDCPDQTQQQGYLIHSPYNSEHQARSWAGSASHNSSRGPCKHIYSAAFYRGEPFPRPAGGNAWDYPYHPERIRLDWDYNAAPATPSPAHGDWTEQQYRAWRRERRDYHRHQAQTRRSDRAMLDRMFRNIFEQYGISDRSDPQNRYYQYRYRELYSWAHAPNADQFFIDQLTELEWDLSQRRELDQLTNEAYDRQSQQDQIDGDYDLYGF